MEIEIAIGCRDRVSLLVDVSLPSDLRYWAYQRYPDPGNKSGAPRAEITYRAGGSV